MLCLLSGPAFAHSEFPGVGSFWNGALHLFVSPEEAIGLFAIGVAVARFGTERMQKPLLAHLLALPLGTIAGLFAAPAELESLRALPLLAPGVVLIVPAYSSLAYAVGAVGFASAATGFACGNAVPPDTSRLVFAAGMVFGALVVTGAALLVWERLARPWLHIGVRIAGSWMVAIGVMLLGAALR